MAVRLSVIMVHTPPASAASAELAESVVGQLIGLPEIDLMLIGPLARLADGSTDRLSLESISGDVALLDWQTAESSLADLERLGFEGSRAPHDHDPHQPNVAAAVRRIYAFDLNKFSTGESVCSAILGLKNRRQVRTFSLSMGMPNESSRTATQAVTATRPNGSDRQAEKPDRESNPNAVSLSSTSPTSGAEPPSPVTPPATVADSSSVTESTSGIGASRPTTDNQNGGKLDLDHLLDQLDELDP